jgi:hypothetical protein
MHNKTYEEMGDKLEELIAKHDAFASEENRLAFRAEWTAFIEASGWTEDEYETALCDRILA